MFVIALDVKAAHINNPDCPSRLVRKPSGGWMCLDCGLDIIQKRINTDDATAPVMQAIQRLEELGARRKPCLGRPAIRSPVDAELPDLIGKDSRCICRTYNGDDLNCPAHYGTSAESRNE